MNQKIKRKDDHFILEDVADQQFYLDVMNEDTPCDGCIHAQKCGQKRLACFAFALYVNNGTVDWTIPRSPTRNTYARIMWREDVSLTREVNKYAREHSLS